LLSKGTFQKILVKFNKDLQEKELQQQQEHLSLWKERRQSMLAPQEPLWEPKLRKLQRSAKRRQIWPSWAEAQ
jgi:hypothetical protein